MAREASSGIERPHRLRLIVRYGLRALLYNIAVTLIGAVGIFAFRLAATDASLNEALESSVAVTVVLGPILLMTGGYLLSLAGMRLFHHREAPVYVNHGIGQGALGVGAWILALAAGALLLVAGRFV